jgi:cation transport regulator ChaB
MVPRVHFSWKSARHDNAAIDRSHLPPHAHDIFRATFNNTWRRYGERYGTARGDRASVRKVGEPWVQIGAFA